MSGLSRDTISADAPYWLSKDDHDEVRSYSSTKLRHGDLSIARYRRNRHNKPETASGSNPSADMFSVVVALQPRAVVPGYRNGHSVLSPAQQAGMLHIFDLREIWAFDLPLAFDSFMAYVPKAAVDEVTRDLNQPAIEQFCCSIETSHRDLVIYGLAQSLIPLLERPSEGNRLFTDHIFSAIILYIAQQYGGARPVTIDSKAFGRRGALTPLQERKAKNRLLDDLTDVPGVAELASICGLSKSHFVRAFRQTTGLPPHRWLLAQRVLRAEALLEGTKMQVAEIALECGFADQSHLTRVFTKSLRVSPQQWRRQRDC